MGAFLSVSSMGPEEMDHHPERRMKAAYAAYEEANMPRLKKENPNMRLSQLKQQLKKEWMKAPENPLNQRFAAYNSKWSNCLAPKLLFENCLPLCSRDFHWKQFCLKVRSADESPIINIQKTISPVQIPLLEQEDSRFLLARSQLVLMLMHLASYGGSSASN